MKGLQTRRHAFSSNEAREKIMLPTYGDFKESLRALNLPDSDIPLVYDGQHLLLLHSAIPKAQLEKQVHALGLNDAKLEQLYVEHGVEVFKVRKLHWLVGWLMF